MVRIFVAGTLLLLLSCSDSHQCNPGAPQKIMTIPVNQNGSTSYHHCILVEGLSKSCDSAVVMPVIKLYLQDNRSDLPVSGVSVFQSVRHFDRGETLSQARSFYGDCVVEVWFDPSSGMPRSFYFYNNSGHVNFEGVKWKP